MQHSILLCGSMCWATRSDSSAVKPQRLPGRMPSLNAATAITTTATSILRIVSSISRNTSSSTRARRVRLFAQLGEPICTTDIIPYEEFKKTRFYREWAKPQKLADFAATMLDKTATSIAFLGLFRHERDGLFDDEARRQIRLLVPHFRRALLIGNLIDLKTAEAASLADTLDGIGAGMFLVDADGRVVHANVAGRAMLNAASVLRRGGWPSDAARSRCRGDFIGCIDDIRQRRCGAWHQGRRSPSPCARRRSLCRARLAAHVGRARRAGTKYSAAAALFVHRAALDAPSLPEVIATTYKLTPMELRVSACCRRSRWSSGSCRFARIAESTVKTVLGRTYQKTGTARQADLVKLVAGFSSPLAP